FSGADGSVLRTLSNPQGGNFAGPVAGIGDVNGDGAPDLLVGVPNQIAGGIVTGRAFVFSGADASLLRILDNPNPSGFARFGSALSGAGDVNGDGVPELLVGAPGQGQAFVFSGADATLLLTLTRSSSGSFGEVVAGIGDVDGDGAPDFLVGAPDQNVGGRLRQGRAFVVLSVALGLARTQVPCTSIRCRLRARCDLSPAFGTACTNPLRLLVDIPRRLAGDVAGKGRNRVGFAFSNATNVPPGETRNVTLRLTRAGKQIFKTSTTNRLRGVIEIRNTPGTVIDTPRIRIRLRRR
ncbi:MAG: FG-GAP-like repeat-containing protein, partial [candidate division NC10 bacterium]|nr:FG-GAP-like repeat-containing protein [candidate division NC10 bacterium]